jgi:sigma-B regulation protein RsbU (phosphoserine phosphatase)
MADTGPDPAPAKNERDLYDLAPCGLLVTSTDGLIDRVNATFCSWIGRGADELVGRVRIQDLFTVGGRIFHQTQWAPLLQMQGSVAEVKLEVMHPDGRRIPMVFNAVRRVSEARTWHELAAFVADDRDKYERELVLARRHAEDLLAKEQAAQAALGAAQVDRDRQRAVAAERGRFAEQMMAIVSHDLRNPLSVIRMSATLIGMGDLSSNQLRALERLTSSTSRATRLIADLLDFSQAKLGGGLQIRRQAVDLHALVADSVEDFRIAYPGRSIEHRQAGTGSCEASADRFVQLLGNLMSNALAYGDSSLPVVVSSAIMERSFSIAVKNSGPPIDPQAMPTLFDTMTRSSDLNGHHSVGLGLFIVRAIAAAHGGEVGVVSSAEAGTTFTAEFPRRGIAGAPTSTVRPAD